MLEALGNLGDFVGGIAVVVTLIYLAVQVRQNTLQLREAAKLARIQARDVSFQTFCEFRAKIVANADVAELYLKGLRDPESLEPPDRLRFHLLASELFHLMQASVIRVRALGSEDQEELIDELGIESVVQAPGIVHWWKQNRDGFRPEFAAMVDAHIAAPRTTA